MSVDPLAEQTMTPYQYVHNNPIMFTDPTGMSAESCEIDPPKKEKPRSATEQGVINVGKKYLATALNIATDPLGTAQSALSGFGQEAREHIEKREDVGTAIIGKATDTYNGYVNRIKNSQDPSYEFKVVMAELQTEVVGNFLIGEGIGALAGRVLGGTAAAATEGSAMNILKSPVIRSVDDIFADPGILQGKSLNQVQKAIKGTNGWVEGTLNKGRSKGQGWTFRKMNSRGTDFTGDFIQYSPGSSRHFGGNPYWKFSTGKTRDLRFQASKK